MLNGLHGGRAAPIHPCITRRKGKHEFVVFNSVQIQIQALWRVSVFNLIIDLAQMLLMARDGEWPMCVIKKALLETPAQNKIWSREKNTGRHYVCVCSPAENTYSRGLCWDWAVCLQGMDPFTAGLRNVGDGNVSPVVVSLFVLTFVFCFWTSWMYVKGSVRESGH